VAIAVRSHDADWHLPTFDELLRQRFARVAAFQLVGRCFASTRHQRTVRAKCEKAFSYGIFKRLTSAENLDKIGISELPA
jgi:hypothetical protein